MIQDLNQILQDLHLDANCVNAFQHRHFAFYDLKLGPKCRINRIKNLSREIALRVRSKSEPLVQALMSQGVVRIQMVMEDPSPLPIASIQAKYATSPGLLPFLLGETSEGTPLWVDMAQNPHLIIAGATGSGKSVTLHNLIANALKVANTKLLLVDPKGVEFGVYQNLPSVWSVVNSYTDTIDLLQHLHQIMESRYKLLQSLNINNIDQNPNCLDKIVVIIDEAADLMLLDGKKKQFENLIVKLAQKCRAAGIYLVLATQRPSTDVLTGLIKANFPARIACKVSSRVDSQVILDQPGAELLVGRGDAIIKTNKYNMVRFQVAYTSPSEIK